VLSTVALQRPLRHRPVSRRQQRLVETAVETGACVNRCVNRFRRRAPVPPSVWPRL
jgi:hypothetical protein